MSSATSFYEQLDETTFRATEATVGPWDAASQHAGPPSALLGRTLELADPREELMLARVTTEILGPVPTPADLTVTARVARPGKRVEMVEAEMAHAGRPVMLARGWRIARVAADLPVDDAPRQPPPLPADSDPDPGNSGGYFTSMEWRWVNGHFTALGPATVWARMRVPLVDGEEPSPWQRVLCLADSANGISNRLPMADWLFINTELTVHLFREPVGDWVCMDAVSHAGTDGVGLATSRLFDAQGQVGRGAQALLIAER
ncbi:MAG TPA: thioesterase family protein [Mycobacteriales bacterium]|nr:thioesterase family protein [Mycobacteriales bacterium]